MKEVKVKEGLILQHNGELNTKIDFIKSGLLRSYSIDQKGKEHIFMFVPENWTIADSISPDSPSELFIEALEDSTVFVLDKKLENSAETEPLINRINVLQKRSSCL